MKPQPKRKKRRKLKFRYKVILLLAALLILLPNKMFLAGIIYAQHVCLEEYLAAL